MTAPQSVRRLKRVAIVVAIVVVVAGLAIRDVRVDRNTPHAGVWVAVRGGIVMHVFRRPELGSYQFGLYFNQGSREPVYTLVSAAIGKTCWLEVRH